MLKRFDDRRKIWVHPKVTQRIMEGVIATRQRAVHFPGEGGINQDGYLYVLTKAEGSPGGAIPFNTTSVEIVKCK